MADQAQQQHAPIFSGSSLFSSTETRILLPFAAIGSVWLATRLLNFLYLLLDLFVLPGKPLKDFGPPGSWALVTGASDGIGLEFAHQLAAKKFNVLLVSRTESKLQKLAAAISEKHGVETRIQAMDFAHPTEKDWKALAAHIGTVEDVAVLINNVGQSHEIPVPFAETERREMEAIVEINCAGTLKVTSLVLPGMLARKRGLILTMGSFGGLLPTPLLATYSGSKAFLQQWSSALGAEVADKGVTVSLIQSYLVASAMSKIRRTSALVPSPRNFVRAVLARVGREGGAQGFAYSSTPYWSHALMQWALGSFVGFNNGFVVDQNYGMHLDIRARALRKRQREALEAGKKSE